MTAIEQIVAHVTGYSHYDMAMHRPVFTSKQHAHIKQLWKQVVAGRPLQYVLGYAYFFGLRFQVNESVLIPRPETEILVDDMIHRCQIRTDVIDVMDVGTGSGSIAVTIAKQIKTVKIDALDVSPKALIVAKKNAKSFGVAHHIQFVEQNMLDYFKPKPAVKQYDFILANPPYIATADIKNLPRDVQCEPVLALDGGDDGLDYVRFLIENTGDWLKPNGVLAIEIGDDQSLIACQCVVSHQGLRVLDVIKDLRGVDRFVLCVKD